MAVEWCSWRETRRPFGNDSIVRFFFVGEDASVCRMNGRGTGIRNCSVQVCVLRASNRDFLRMKSADSACTVVLSVWSVSVRSTQGSADELMDW